MNPDQLYESYRCKKDAFYDFIDNIKKNSIGDLYTIVNATLIKNYYTSTFPKKFFINQLDKYNLFGLFIKNTLFYYYRNFYLLLSYIIASVLFRIFFHKKRVNELKVIIDTYGLVNNVNRDNKFVENYFTGVYDVFDKLKAPYTILFRPYLVGKNPFKLVKYFKILQQENKDFLFDYELVSIFDFVEMFWYVLAYPFKTLRLMQPKNTLDNQIFNEALIEDLRLFNFESITRYIAGKNIAKIDTVEKIFSWSEFQVIERSFNYAIRKNNSKIRLIACQFFISYETYFNTFADDTDYDMMSSPHTVLVNGKYYIKDTKKVKYDCGVSLRYKNIFSFDGIKEAKDILLLGSYVQSDTRYIIDGMQNFDKVIFKNHPAVDINNFGNLPSNMVVTTENVYKLFENASIVVSTASGTAIEAVSCGVSVIIVASADNLTANPLVEYGKGKIWDIANNTNEILDIYNNLIDYRSKYQDEIKQISLWYKDNFFVEPTQENIINVFELNKEND